jgi:hypothetical protein
MASRLERLGHEVELRTSLAHIARCPASTPHVIAAAECSQRPMARFPDGSINTAVVAELQGIRHRSSPSL